VVVDRSTDGGDAGRDVLVGDRIAALARRPQLLEERGPRRRRLVGQGLRRDVLEILVPELRRLEREQRP